MPTRTLRELQGLLKSNFNIDVDTSTIHRRLVADGISCKRIREVADDQGEIRAQPRTTWPHLVKGFLTPIPENERYPVLDEYFPPSQVPYSRVQCSQLPRSKTSQEKAAKRQKLAQKYVQENTSY